MLGWSLQEAYYSRALEKSLLSSSEINARFFAILDKMTSGPWCGVPRKMTSLVLLLKAPDLLIACHALWARLTSYSCGHSHIRVWWQDHRHCVLWKRSDPCSETELSVPGCAWGSHHGPWWCLEYVPLGLNCGHTPRFLPCHWHPWQANPEARRFRHYCSQSAKYIAGVHSILDQKRC